MISVPEIVILSAVSILNDRKLFPCVTEEIFWDLTACVPTWSNKTVFIYTTIKACCLYVVPAIVMLILYRSIIITLSNTINTRPGILNNAGEDGDVNKVILLRRHSKVRSNLHTNLKTGKKQSLNSPNVQEEKRRKTAHMLLALVVVFFISNFPVHSLNILVFVAEYLPTEYKTILNNFLNH